MQPVTPPWKSMPSRWWMQPLTCMRPSSPSFYQLLLRVTTHSTWEISQRSSKVFKKITCRNRNFKIQIGNVEIFFKTMEIESSKKERKGKRDQKEWNHHLQLQVYRVMINWIHSVAKGFLDGWRNSNWKLATLISCSIPLWSVWKELILHPESSMWINIAHRRPIFDSLLREVAYLL